MPSVKAKSWSTVRCRQRIKQSLSQSFLSETLKRKFEKFMYLSEIKLEKHFVDTKELEYCVWQFSDRFIQSTRLFNSSQITFVEIRTACQFQLDADESGWYGKQKIHKKVGKIIRSRAGKLPKRIEVVKFNLHFSHFLRIQFRPLSHFKKKNSPGFGEVWNIASFICLLLARRHSADGRLRQLLTRSLTRIVGLISFIKWMQILRWKHCVRYL